MKPITNTEYDHLTLNEIGGCSEMFLTDHKHEGYQYVDAEDSGYEDDTGTYLYQREYFSLKFCPYCHGNMHEAKTKKLLTKPMQPAKYRDGMFNNVDLSSDAYLHVGVKVCGNCKFWMLDSFSDYNRNTTDISWMRSVVRKFLTEVPTHCHSELATYCRRNPEYFHSINPIELEKFVASVWKENYKDCEVMHVGGPNDKGVDVLYIDSGGEDWFIQVKRRSSSVKPEQFSTIQSLAGSLVLQGKFKGIVVSTANYFSPPALEAAQKLNGNGYTVELVDQGKLNRMLSPLLPKKPWQGGLESIAPEALNEIEYLLNTSVR